MTEENLNIEVVRDENIKKATVETIKKDENPWRKSIRSITWGFILTLITFDFLYLQYILPVLGSALLFIGFRELRKENKSLYNAWIFSIGEIILQILKLIYISTPLNIRLNSGETIAFIMSLYQIFFLLVFRSGVKKAIDNAKVELTRDPLLWAVVWEICIIICTVFEITIIFFVFISLIIWYIFIFHSLYRLADDLADIDFINKEKDVTFSNKKCILALMSGCIGLVSICNVVFNHIRLDYTEFISSKDSEIRESLRDKGFPSYILKDIADEDIALLKNVVNIDTSSKVLMFDSKTKEIQQENIIYHNEMQGEINLKATSIYIELKNRKIYGFEYLEWQDGSAYWSDYFSMGGSDPLELINGQLLFKMKGKEYVSSIPKLEIDTSTNTDIFDYMEEFRGITGILNYPFGSEDQRGYIFYRIDLKDEKTWTGMNVFNYTHYRYPFRLPYLEGEREDMLFGNAIKQHGSNYYLNEDR